MFESGNGPGTRSDRFGTWSLITFLFMFVPFLSFSLGPVAWLPIIACAAATLGAWGYGLVGVFVRGERRAALHGLLKAAVPTVVGGSFVLLLVALSSMSWE